MKKIYLFILLWFTTCSVVFSQNYQAGIIAEIGGCQVDGDLYTGYRKLGGGISGFVNYQIHSFNYLQMELGYTQRGSQQNANYSKNQLDAYKLTLNYIDLKLIYCNSFFTKIIFEGGIIGSYLIGAKEEIDNIENIIDPSFRKFACTGLLGLKYNLNEYFNFSFRYEYSLIALRTNPTYGNIHRLGQFGSFSNSFMLGVEYTLGGGLKREN